jgi:Zn-dependent protease with chaperone function
VSPEHFDALVSRLEKQASANPGGYRTRVLLFALLGNLYLFAMVAFLFVLFLFALASIVFLKALGIKIAFVVGAFLWVVVRALWVKFPPPAGTEIGAHEAPELFAEIEELRAALNAPRFHHVLVTDDFNAAVVQVPRLGLLGWDRNYLLIGLPLAKALGVEQFKAVLAHEYGHLAGGHGRMSNWIYRQRVRWMRLMDALQQVESKATFLFSPFLRWYAPHFSAYSYPLARANEFEADAASARLTSPHAAAQALTGVNVFSAYLNERYWPGIHKQADEQPAPGFAPYSGLAARVEKEIDEASVKGWIESALARKTTTDDSHPCFSERLAALGQEAAFALPGPEAAADRLLGASREALTRDFDKRWHEAVLPAWKRRYEETQKGRARLAELNARHASGAELSPQEAYDRACLTEIHGNDPEGAIAQIRTMLEESPGSPVLLYALGIRLLARGDDAGRPLVEQAMASDENAIVPGCQAIRDYLWRQRREVEAREWDAKLVARAELEQAAAKEREGVRSDEKFEVHSLAPDALDALVGQLRKVEGLQKVYFVKKRLQHLPHRPLYILGFTMVGLWYSKKKAIELVGRLQQTVNFPGETLILSVGGENYCFGRKFKWMRGSRIL